MKQPILFFKTKHTANELIKGNEVEIWLYISTTLIAERYLEKACNQKNILPYPGSFQYNTNELVLYGIF
jgi:hypothetical protein